MKVSQQRVHSLQVKLLKNLIEFQISFEPFHVTAILGPNGSGKSTILHALACAFSPNENGEDYKFSRFFLPNTDALWGGSELSIVHSYRDGKLKFDQVVRGYQKTSSRWTPRYANRPRRDVLYIGIDKCVPMIESEKKQARINYSTMELNESVINTILEKASIILNKKYLKYHIHVSSEKQFIGVEIDGLRYSALSMSAGEQKVFYILERIFRAKKYSLILMDELDLLLHDQAMKKLIEVIVDIAKTNELQVVFTTHRDSVIDFEGKVNIRHVVCRAEKTLCFNETKPDAINRLTGIQPKLLEVFVEDDLAAAIVKKVASRLRISKHVSVTQYGAAMNCFTAVGGLMLGGDSCINSLFVLDGDVFRTAEEKDACIKKVLTGHDNKVLHARTAALSVIMQFKLPVGTKPEKYIHSLISGMTEGDSQEINEVIEVAKELIVVDDDHRYVSDIINRLGLDRASGLSKIVDLIANLDEWSEYTNDVHQWFESKVVLLREKAQ